MTLKWIAARLQMGTGGELVELVVGAEAEEKIVPICETRMALTAQPASWR